MPVYCKTGQFLAVLAFTIIFSSCGNLSKDNSENKGPQNTNSTWDQVEKLSQKSGIPILNPDVDQHPDVDSAMQNKDIADGFAWYNPDFIRWINENLLPKNEEEGIKKWSACMVYQQRFQSKIRRLYSTYLIINEIPGRCETESELYLNAMKTDSFVGPKYLRQRAKQISEKEINSEAFGFWLRRNADNTEAELAKGMVGILDCCDAKWKSEETAKLHGKK